MRSFVQIKRENASVLIIDKVGSEFLEYCIPESVSFSILPIRGVIPWLLNFSFIFKFFIYLFRLYDVKKALIFSIIEVLDPKVLITFIDNSPLLGEIYGQFPKKLAISVQNGFRSGFKYKEGSFSQQPMPTFYGFGAYEKNLLECKGIDTAEFIPAGSLRYGIFKKYFFINAETIDICYISDYIAHSDTEQLKILKNYSQNLFSILTEVCKDLCLDLTVVMRSDDKSEAYNCELDYYRSMDKYNTVNLISRNVSEFRSYNIAINSRLIVCNISTLGFEMLGARKKVLFGACADDSRLSKSWDSEGNFSKIPGMLLLDRFNVGALHKKLFSLLKMSDKQYADRTKDARLHYMNNGQVTVHERVRSRIDKYLKD